MTFKSEVKETESCNCILQSHRRSSYPEECSPSSVLLHFTSVSPVACKSQVLCSHPPKGQVILVTGMIPQINQASHDL